jgi:hypothetical protein
MYIIIRKKVSITHNHPKEGNSCTVSVLFVAESEIGTESYLYSRDLTDRGSGPEGSGAEGGGRAGYGDFGVQYGYVHSDGRRPEPAGGVIQNL